MQLPHERPAEPEYTAETSLLADAINKTLRDVSTELGNIRREMSFYIGRLVAHAQLQQETIGTIADAYLAEAKARSQIRARQEKIMDAAEAAKATSIDRSGSIVVAIPELHRKDGA